jgi:hypothetical protein
MLSIITEPASGPTLHSADAGGTTTDPRTGSVVDDASRLQPR